MVTPEMIATALGRPSDSTTPEERAQWDMWISDAYMLITDRATALSVTPDAAKVDYVVREAVMAHLRNPDDATQVSVSVDDGAMSRTYRSGSGRVGILDEWWALLGLASQKGAAFSIRPAASTGSHMPWCALAFGALYCSCMSDINRYEDPLYEGGILSPDSVWP